MTLKRQIKKFSPLHIAEVFPGFEKIIYHWTFFTGFGVSSTIHSFPSAINLDIFKHTKMNCPHELHTLVKENKIYRFFMIFIFCE